MDFFIGYTMGTSFFSGEFPVIAAFYKYLFIMIFLGSAIGKIVTFNGTLAYFAPLTSLSIPELASLLWILIILEFLIPVMVLMNGLKSKTIFLLIQLLLVTFFITNILFFFLGAETCACFGESIQTHPTLGILKTLFLIMIVNYIRKGKYFPIQHRIRKTRG